MTVRVRAPELRGRGWLNTGGRELTLADLRGKIVLLDFWTFCCINCLHVLDELRPLEEKYGDVLVVIGVHSPKFEHERDPDALAAAVERYGVAHPVLDDPELGTWDQYAAKAWPTLTVVDPEGYVVASMAGEGHAEGLARLVDELIATHDGEGHPAPRRRPVRAAGRAARPPCGSPARRSPCPTATCWSSDSARHALVELAPDGETVVRRIGSGERGRADGPPEDARFSEPQGCACCRRTRRRSPGTTWWSPTPSTTCCAASARHRRGRHRRRHRPAVAVHRGRPRPRRASPSTSPRRGTWPGTTTG